jgi:hypothetical protein
MVQFCHALGKSSLLGLSQMQREAYSAPTDSFYGISGIDILYDCFSATILPPPA